MTAEQKLKLIEKYVREELETEEIESAKYDPEENSMMHHIHSEKYGVLHDMLRYISSLNERE